MGSSTVKPLRASSFPYESKICSARRYDQWHLLLPADISEHCECRKPKPGMLLRAAKEHGLDLSTCWMIGDAASDIEAGKGVGCKTVRILPIGSMGRNGPKADMQATDLSSAVRKVLRSVRLLTEVSSS